MRRARQTHVMIFFEALPFALKTGSRYHNEVDDALLRTLWRMVDGGELAPGRYL